MNRPQSDKKRLGKWGEQFAARYLQQHGFYILAQNFHSSLGEVDIVAEDQNCLVLSGLLGQDDNGRFQRTSRGKSARKKR